MTQRHPLTLSLTVFFSLSLTPLIWAQSCDSTDTLYITEGSIPPGDYPREYLSPLHATALGGAAIPSTIRGYIVDMAASEDDPYVLGSFDDVVGGKADFAGTATICHTHEPGTGTEYDIVAAVSLVGQDPGGVYAISLSFNEFPSGTPRTMTKQIFVNADSGGWDRNCLGAAAEEHTPFARDLVLTPSYYVTSGDLFMAYLRGAYVPWTQAGTIGAMANAINATYATLGNQKVTVVFGSHGWTDTWWLARISHKVS